jgi:iron-sulfur cluster assembly protein
MATSSLLDALTWRSSKNGDRVLESNGIDIHIDKKSYLYLMGFEIDYIDELPQSGFKFNNLNAKRTCGCGESFSV